MSKQYTIINDDDDNDIFGEDIDEDDEDVEEDDEDVEEEKDRKNGLYGAEYDGEKF
jgi:hypothetical protein